MAQSATEGIHCRVAGSANLGAWFSPVPCGDKLTGRLSWRRLSLPEAYLMMVGVVTFATLIRVAISPYIPGAQFPFFFLAVIICAFCGGVCVGLMSVVLSALSANLSSKLHSRSSSPPARLLPWLPSSSSPLRWFMSLVRYNRLSWPSMMASAARPHWQNVRASPMNFASGQMSSTTPNSASPFSILKALISATPMKRMLPRKR